MHKKRKLIKSVCAAAAFMAVQSMSVSAAEVPAGGGFEFNIDVEPDIPVITVSGRLEENGGQRLAAIEVIYIGEITSENVSGEDNDAMYAAALAGLESGAAAAPYYYDAVITDNGGNYSFSYPQAEGTGVYAVRIRSENDADTRYYVYFSIAKEEITAAFDRVNKAAEDELYDLLEEESYKLSLDRSVYDTLPEQNKKNVCVIAVKNRSAAAGKVFASLDDFKRTMKEAAAIEQMNMAKSGSDVSSAVAQNIEIYGLKDEDAYKTFDTNSDIQSYMYQRMADDKSDFVFMEELRKCFRESVLLTAVEKCGYWTDLREIITVNNSWLKLDNYDKYTGSKADAADKVLAGKSYSSADGFRTAFAAAISSAGGGSGGSGSGSSGSGGGSGGGGSSGGSYGVTTLPENKPGTQSTEQTASAEYFSDLGGVEWARNSINLLAEAGIASGKAEGMFFPNDCVTRGEFVKLLVTALGLEKPGAKCSFDDVSRDDWCYPYIASAYRAGVISGTDDNLAGAEQYITRQDMAVMSERAAAAAGISFVKKCEEKAFDDAEEIADYAVKTVKNMQTAGIINGMEDNTFAPLGYTTRAEAAVIIHRLMKLK